MSQIRKTQASLNPRATLRIGLVGHRMAMENNRLPPVDSVKKLLASVYDCAAAAMSKIHSDYGSVFSGETPVCRLVTSLASGADIIAQQTLPDDWHADIILPMPAGEFRLDFPETDARTEKQQDGDAAYSRRDFDEELSRLGTRSQTRILSLPMPVEDRAKAYADAAEMILSNCDLLLVVWDGGEQDREPHGGAPALIVKQGGTAWTAVEAIKRGLPVIWLDCANDKAHQLYVSAEAARLFSVQDVDSRHGPLAETIDLVLSPPHTVNGQDHGHVVFERLTDALCEKERGIVYCISYDWLTRVLTREPLRLWIRLKSLDERSAEWDKYLEGAPASAAPLCSALKSVLLPRFASFDTLAQAYGHRYRGAYVAVFLFSAIAVLVGLLSVLPWPLLFPDHDAHEIEIVAKGIFAVGELIFIGLIILFVWHGQKVRSHERWLDYRSLAETLRHFRFLSFVGAAGAAPYARKPGEAPAEAWQLWYARATTREIGIPTGEMNHEYCWQVLRQVRDYDLDEQRVYHDGNFLVQDGVHKALHKFGDSLFWMTAAILIVFFILPWVIFESGLAARFHLTDDGLLHYLIWAKPVVTVLAAGLPALGAALAGIRVQGDFDGFAMRSQRTAQVIGTLTESLKLEQSHVDLVGTTQILQTCARVMSEDVEAWEALYGRKALVFPS